MMKKLSELKTGNPAFLFHNGKPEVKKVLDIYTADYKSIIDIEGLSFTAYGDQQITWNGKSFLAANIQVAQVELDKYIKDKIQKLITLEFKI